jgi:hypothetical protein
VDELALLVHPLAGLVFLTVAGAGGAVALAPRFPADAQAALAVLVGAALIAAASVLLPLGAPARPLAAGAAAAGATATLLLLRRSARALRAVGVPLAVALAAIVLASVPSLARGDWHVTSLYGSTDAYHWTSQARAYLDGPAPPPSSEHPDRLSYERSKDQHWAVGLPFGLLTVAWISGSDPADVYGAFAALVFCLLPLAGYAAARVYLGWRPAVAAAVALALAGNAALLFASHFAWQQQLAGSAFAFAAAVSLGLALERGGPRRELALAALLAAAALATYRLGFAPYLAGLLLAVVVAVGWTRRRSAGGPGAVARGAAAFVLAFAALAAPSLAGVAAGLPEFVASGGFSTEFKRTFPSGQLAEGLGLVPRVWGVRGSWPTVPMLAWLAAGWLVAAVLLARGLLAAGRAGAPRLGLVAAGAVVAVAAYAFVLLPPFSAYLSFKLLSYTAPFLVLVALVPVALRGARERIGTLVVLAAFAVPSAALATAAAIDDSRTPGSLAALADAASAVPRDAVVSVDLDDPWEQAWAIYYLRGRRISVERPSFLLTAQGLDRDPLLYRHRPIDYRLVRDGSTFALLPA